VDAGGFASLVRPNGPYARIDVVASTGSTNADLLAAAGAGAADRTVLIAEEQTAGRGRRARQWVSPTGAGLYLSVLLRPGEVPTARLGTLSMVAGLALVRAVRAATGVPVVLKWPNDLLAGAGGGKCAGVLAEVGPRTAVVLGVGLNVTPSPVPVPLGPGALPATSLADHGARTTDRAEIASALLAELDRAERAWRGARGDLGALLDDYRAACATLGRRVRVELTGQELTGTAVDIDPLGSLVVAGDDGTRHSVSAGDVVHLRGGP